MAALGSNASDFRLTDVVSGRTISLDTFAGKKALLVMFLSRHCPFVQHIKEELARIGRDYAKREVGIVAVSANDIVNYPDDAPEKLKEMAVETGFRFPFCHDETQEVAKSYSAACTPDFFLYDQKRKLVYRGQLDDSRPGNGKPIDGHDLRAALEAILQGRPVPQDQKPSVGCNIKWKPGNEPEYFK
jgi:peroxiredoxin